MSTLGEFLMRLITRAFYIVFAATIFVLVFSSNVQYLNWLGILGGFFLIDRLIHLGEGEKSLNELKGEKINLALAVTPGAYNLLSLAFHKALVTRRSFYLTFLRVLIDRREIQEALKRLDVPAKDFMKKNDEFLLASSEIQNREEILRMIEVLTREAYVNASALKEKFIEPRNFLVALAGLNLPEISKLLDLFDVKADDLQEAIIFGRFRGFFRTISRLPSVLGGFVRQQRFLRHRVMNRAWTARPTPTLDQFSTDLTDLARAERAGFLIGHEKEFSEMLNVISRPGKPNALLVGEPGIGKSSVIAHLAFRIVKDEVPPILFDKRLVSLEIADFLANATPEILSGRIQKMVEEIVMAGNIVLVVPNIHDLFRTAQGRALNAIDLLLPIVKNQAIPVIGETYPREFKALIQPRSDFLEQFEVINFTEISEAETVRYLTYYSLILERQYKVFITFKAIQKSVELAHRYLRQKPLPASAADLLKQSLAKAKENKFKKLQADLVVAVAEEESQIPIRAAGAAETEKLLNLEVIIHEKLIDQSAAVSAVARALREYRSGLSRKGGPIATFLFVGPTGVGKTELSKILAEIQFGSKEMMIRFDMSEYQDKQSIFRFIGTPDGEKTGALTDAVLAKPYSLVLLDEFEKAHPDILNLFLQVFDDGRLTDSLGRTVNFENTIIIATSNANSDFIKGELEKGQTIENIAGEVKRKLTDYFKPELINRFSDTIVFKTLSEDEIYAVTKILLREVAGTVREAQSVDIDFDDAAVKRIAELGYSPVFGARPLRQVISAKVRGVLAEKILRKEISRGDTLKMVLENGEIQFQIKNQVYN